MPRTVSGFLADDGTFFVSPEECEEYEARVALQEVCDSNDWDWSALATVLTYYSQMIGRYINAYEAACKVRKEQIQATAEEVDNTGDYVGERPRGERGDAAGIGPREQPGTTETSTALQQLETRGSEYVHSLGSGERAENVPEAGTSTSTRVRDDRAPNVRRRKDMATRTDTETG